MCDIGIALAIGSTLIGGAGAIQQGKAASNAATYNSRIAEMNATLADRRAKDALERGKIAEQAERAKTAQLLGRQQAAMGANGVDLSFGSPLDLMVDTKISGEIDALTIKSNAAREAWDYQTQGVGFRSEAGTARSTAKSASTAGMIGAFSTVLTGGAKAYGDYGRPGSALTVRRGQ